jgi:hypothetical protein
MIYSDYTAGQVLILKRKGKSLREIGQELGFDYFTAKQLYDRATRLENRYKELKGIK